MLEALRAVAIFNFLFLIIKDDEILRVSWDTVYKFVSAMVIITVLRLIVLYGTNPMMLQVDPSSFLLVGAEDLSFGGTIYIFSKYVTTRQLFLLPVMILVSLFFGVGHLAYGLPWAILMCFLPVFVFVKYGVKHGIYTTMICHVMFDAMTFFMAKFIHIMTLLNGY